MRDPLSTLLGDLLKRERGRSERCWSWTSQ